MITTNKNYLNICPTDVIVRTMTITCKTSHIISHDFVCKNLKTGKYIISKKYKKDGYLYIEGTPSKPIKKTPNDDNSKSILYNIIKFSYALFFIF